MSRIRGRRASEESLASADDSIDETRSVMSFILSRMPENAGAMAEAVAGSAAMGCATASTTTLAYGAPSGDGVQALPPPFPVAVRKRHIPWAALVAHFPRLLRLLLLLMAHAALLTAFVETGWDPEHPWCQGSGLFLLVLAALDACLVSGCCLRRIPRKKLSTLYNRVREQVSQLAAKKFFSRIACALVLFGVVLFVAIDSGLHRSRIAAALGMVLLIVFGYIFSKNRSKVKWRPVLSGLLLQFMLGLLLVRWHVGRGALVCIAEKVDAVVSFAGRGASFVFGYLSTGELEGGLPRQQPVLAFTVVSTIVFFGLLVSVLCHYGVLQFLAHRFGRLIAAALGTAACESYCAACNVFLGMADSAILIKPYLAQLTKSELHSVMACGFATISGSLFAVFTTLGVKAEHMMAASLMSAPAALGFSKLLYPEAEESGASREKMSDVRKSYGPECTVLESMSRGVSSLFLVAANVVATLLGFLACMALTDAVLAYLGAILGWNSVTLKMLVGRLLLPLALAMGVSLDECTHVACLVGLKTALNEVVAYTEMVGLTQRGLLSPRAQLVCTHALCGFSSIGALGVQLGAYAALAPGRLPDCARVAGRALVAGSVACFMTACTAGALTDTAAYEVPARFNSYDFV